MEFANHSHKGREYRVVIPSGLCPCGKGQALGEAGMKAKVRAYIDRNADTARSNGYELVTEDEYREITRPDCEKCYDTGRIDRGPEICDCEKGAQLRDRECPECGGGGIVNVRMDKRGSLALEIRLPGVRAALAIADGAGNRATSSGSTTRHASPRQWL